MTDGNNRIPGEIEDDAFPNLRFVVISFIVSQHSTLGKK